MFSGPGFSSFSGRAYLLFQRKRHTGVAHMQTFCVSDQIHVQYWSAGEKFGMHWDAHCVGWLILNNLRLAYVHGRVSWI